MVDYTERISERILLGDCMSEPAPETVEDASRRLYVCPLCNIQQTKTSLRKAWEMFSRV